MLGASEMVRMAARRLPFSFSRYSSHFDEVADRLSAGRREHADLVWLRAMRAALKSGEGGEQGEKRPRCWAWRSRARRGPWWSIAICASPALKKKQGAAPPGLLKGH